MDNLLWKQRRIWRHLINIRLPKNHVPICLICSRRSSIKQSVIDPSGFFPDCLMNHQIVHWLSFWKTTWFLMTIWLLSDGFLKALFCIETIMPTFAPPIAHIFWNWTQIFPVFCHFRYWKFLHLIESARPVAFFHLI